MDMTNLDLINFDLSSKNACIVKILWRAIWSHILVGLSQQPNLTQILLRYNKITQVT